MRNLMEGVGVEPSSRHAGARGNAVSCLLATKNKPRKPLCPRGPGTLGILSVLFQPLDICSKMWSSFKAEAGST